ncbi:MAG: hypothetical protein RSF67_05030, partial [Clostridia bacterium]
INTVLNFYNINNITTNVYTQNYNGNIVDFKLNNNENEIKLNNIKSEFVSDNDNIIFKMYVPDNKEYTYSCKFIINEI